MHCISITISLIYKSSHRSSLKAETKNEEVSISIVDNGIGISSEDLKTLFDPGTLRSKNGTRKEKGTGLGLQLCKEFVERNGGTISAISRIEEGSTFSFTIPVNFFKELVNDETLVAKELTE